MSGFDPGERSSILLRTTTLSHGVMVTTCGFGPQVLGSSPSETTNAEVALIGRAPDL